MMNSNLEEAISVLESKELAEAARLVDSIKDKLAKLGVKSTFILWVKSEDSIERMIGNDGCICCAGDLLNDYIDEHDLVHDRELN